MAHVITQKEREWFARCHRAWDLGSSARRGLEPCLPGHVADFGRAVRDALAVYYFPGMWDWDRAIVLPLVVRAFERSMRRDRDRYTAGQPLSADQDSTWVGQLELGKRLLANYFAWAPDVDRFSPIRVETDVEVNIPHPDRSAEELTASDGAAVRFGGRVDLLVVDPNDVYWIVEHHVVDAWQDVDALAIDERGTAHCWAWERFYLDMRVAGTIYNELLAGAPGVPDRLDRPVPSAPVLRVPQHQRRVTHHRRMYARAAKAPDRRIVQEGTAFFRRTRVPRPAEQLEAFGRQLGRDAMAMTADGPDVGPSPSPEHCPACRFLAPCTVMQRGEDAEPLLAAAFRRRAARTVEEGRLGGVTWGMGRGAAPPERWRDPAPG